MASRRPHDDIPKPTPPPLPKRPAGEAVVPDLGPAPPEPPPPPPVGAPTTDADLQQHLERFLEQARLIIAQQGGLTAAGQAMVDAAARDLGLTREQAAAAVRSLQQTAADDAPPVVAPPVDARWQADAPPRTTKDKEGPQDVFRAYVAEALGRSSRDYVSVRKERKLVAEAVRKLGLAEVLARQIVHQVADECGKRLLSPGGEEDDSDDAADSAELSSIGDFLDRAAAILAEQRGINPKSRVLLAAAASELGLSDEQMERAIASLQEGRDGDQRLETWQRERIASFREYLQQAVAELRHNVITSRMEQKWIDDGQQRHGLDEQMTRRIVRDVLAEHSLRVVSEEQAQMHVAALVKELLGESVRLDGPTRARIFSEGSQWGLAPMQVDAIIREHVRATRRRLASARGLTGILAASAVGVVLVLFALMAWNPWAERRAMPPAEAAPRGPANAARSSAPRTTSVESPTGREWWAKDEELLIAVTKTRIVLPQMKEALGALTLDEPEARGRAYRELVGMAANNVDNDVHRAILQELVAACYAADPSDQSAGAIRQALLDLAPAEGDPLPQDEFGYDAAFWAMRTAVAALSRDSLAAVRADELARGIGRAVQASIDRTLAPADLQRQCLGALCQHLYRVILAAASSQPVVAGPLYLAVTRKAVDYVDTRILEKLHVDFLAIVLPQVGQAWHEYEYLIQRVVNSADPLIVLQLVDVYEELTEASLRDFLGDRLLRRAGVFLDPRSADEVARRVREALGAKHVVTGDDRWKTLVPQVQDLLAQPDAPAADTVKVLQQTLDLAHASTRLCALSLGELGYASYDQLTAEGPIGLAALARAVAPRSGRRSPANPTAASQQKNVLSYIHYLTDPRRRPTSRPVYLHGIASFAPNVPDLEPEPAEALARYLLKAKSDAEHQAILEHVEAVTRWKYVRLALADLVLQTPLYKQRVQELMSHVLQKDLPLADDENWKQRLHDELLRDVIDDLAVAPSRAGGATEIYDDARDSLCDLYRTQARLLGVKPDRYGAAETPADLLRLIVQTQAADLADKAPDEQQSYLADLPHRLAAIDYLGENDLQRTVLLQQLRLDLLSLDLTGRLTMPPHRPDIPAGAARTEKSNVVAQLRDAERETLRTWLLAAPSQP